jgi:superfamily II DNA/RNA helicase
MDHMRQRTIDLTRVEVLVLDEADRMLDMGFILDVRKIIGALPTERQTMLFSATISPEVKALSAGIMKNPEMIQYRRPAEIPSETIRSISTRSTRPPRSICCSTCSRTRR